MDKMIKTQGHYFTGADRVGLLGMDVLGWGHFSIRDTTFEAAQRTLDCFGITYLEKGSGSFESASVPRTRLVPGDLFFLFPGEWHRFGPEHGEFWQEYWFLFDGSTVRHMLDQGYLRTGRTLFRTGADLGIRQTFGISADHVSGDQRQLVYDVLRIIERTAAEATGTAETGTPVHTVSSAIEAHPEAEWDFKATAAEHGMSYSLFRKRFLQQTGTSPGQFVIRERVHKAKSFLAGGMSVSESGRAVGIDDSYYFSRLFKKVAGQSPKAFRDTIRHWRAGHENDIDRNGG